MAVFNCNGTYGSHWHGTVDPWVNWQNEDLNRSSIHVRLIMSADSSLYSQVATTSYNVRVNGGAINSGSRSISLTGPNSVVLIEGDIEVAHDGNGNWSGSYGGALSSGYSGVGAGSGDWAWSLPNLYQGIGFNSVTISNETDVGFDVTVSTNRTANLLQLSIDGGAFTTYSSATYTALTVSVGGASNPIASGKTHTVVCRARRSSNSYTGDSGSVNATTKSQNNFIGLVT